MPENFETTGKSIYFSRLGDDAYVHSDYFFIKCRLVKEPESSHVKKSLIGLVLNRKIGNAVQRNKIKRWIKSIFGKQSLTFPNFAYIIITKKGITELSFQNLENLILDSILKINDRIRRKYCKTNNNQTNH